MAMYSFRGFPLPDLRRTARQRCRRFIYPRERFSNFRGELVYVDPVSLQVEGISSNWLRPACSFARSGALHSVFLLPIGHGHRLVGWTGVALSVICIMGLDPVVAAQWGHWRGAFGVKRGTRGLIGCIGRSTMPSGSGV